MKKKRISSIKFQKFVQNYSFKQIKKINYEIVYEVHF